MKQYPQQIRYRKHYPQELRLGELLDANPKLAAIYTKIFMPSVAAAIFLTVGSGLYAGQCIGEQRLKKQQAEKVMVEPINKTPKKDCREKTGAMVVCPEPIIILRNKIKCMEGDGSIRISGGKRIAPNATPGLTGVKTTVTEVNDSVARQGMFEVEFEIPAGVKGWTKAFRCE
jgi:hypothetical protein